LKKSRRYTFEKTKIKSQEKSKITKIITKKIILNFKQKKNHVKIEKIKTSRTQFLKYFSP